MDNEQPKFKKAKLNGMEDYGAVSDGRLVDIKNRKWLEIEKSPNGYACVNIDNRWYSVAILVWEAFNGPLQPGEKVYTIDHNRMNCALDNLAKFTPEKPLTAEDFMKEMKDLKTVVEEIAELVDTLVKQKEQRVADMTLTNQSECDNPFDMVI